MKKYLHTLFVVAALCFMEETKPQGVAINNDNTNPDPSAMLDVKSTVSGLLAPRMTTSQRTAISSPAQGLLVFDTTTGSFWYYESGWQEMAAGLLNWAVNGNDLYYDQGNVGIGDQSPAAALTVGNDDKFQVDGTTGGVSFTDTDASITFPAVSSTSSPMITMFASGVSNAERMVIAHSPNYPDWGLMYEDVNDAFHIVSNGIKVITFSTSGRIGINKDNPAYALDVNGTARFSGSTFFYAPVSVNSSLSTTGNLTVSGEIKTNTNKGIVRNNTGTQLKVVRTNAALTVTNLGSNNYVNSGNLILKHFQQKTAFGGKTRLIQFIKRWRQNRNRSKKICTRELKDSGELRVIHWETEPYRNRIPNA